MVVHERSKGPGPATKKPKDIGVEPKMGGNPPKWMVYFMENPIKHGMIWGVSPLFLETPIYPIPDPWDVRYIY